MLMSSANNVKLYNLSSGKSLPDWVESRKKKKANEAERRRNIQLLQDFDMPVVSNQVKVSRDGHFICAIGTYKPRLKCYQVEELSMKFERCFDSEAIAFEILSDDYSKMVFLQCDRHVEIHAQFGRYYRFRIPKFGRDLAYHPGTCDTYFVGDSSEIYRLNMEQGRFLQPYQTEATGANVCAVNADHHLLTVGTVNGTVEAWDPRSRQCVGKLDCLVEDGESERGEVTALTFRDALNFGVGLSTGHVLLYDLRSPRPLLVKDHMYGLPVKKIAFQKDQDYVLSLDPKVVKIWERQNGKAYTAIESEVNLNDMAVYPDSGLILLANEQPKLQVHFIPSLGPAPKWCSFLDNITEELEESDITEIYDDYKFVTKDQIFDLGLDHLIGSPLLRAYMHGYFMDVRLYKKAVNIVGTSKLEREDFVKDKVKKQISESRSKRVVKTKLPEVNKDMFLKLQDMKAKGKKKDTASLLQDERFKGLFTDERFAVDTTEEAYRLLNPVISKLDESRAKQIERDMQAERNDAEDESENENSDIFSDDGAKDDESSSDDEEVRNNIKKEFKQIQREVKFKAKEERDFKFYEMEAERFGKVTKKKNQKSLESRIVEEGEENVIQERKDGSHQMVFKRKKSRKQIQEELKNKAHKAERTKVRRSTGNLKHKGKNFT